MTTPNDLAAGLQADDMPRRRAPQGVRTVQELAALNESEMVRGYMAGFKNNADFSQRDPGYWHGYLNGMVDGGHTKASPEQSELARLYVESGALKQDVARWQAQGAPALAAV